MQKNKVTTYLLYAIGEIILVVIGILIAVSINNWNNQLKIQREARAMLENLVRDLESNQKRYQRNIDQYLEYGEKLNDQKEIIHKRDLSDEEIRKVMYYGGAWYRDLNPRKPTYEEMLNSGKIYYLSNDSLVNNLAAYYQELDEAIYSQRESRKEFRAVFFGGDFTDFWFWRGDPDPFPYAREFFLNQETKAYRKLKQCAAWSVSINRFLTEKNEELLGLSEQLLHEISKELKKDNI